MLQEILYNLLPKKYWIYIFSRTGMYRFRCEVPRALVRKKIVRAGHRANSSVSKNWSGAFIFRTTSHSTSYQNRCTLVPAKSKVFANGIIVLRTFWGTFFLSSSSFYCILLTFGFPNLLFNELSWILDWKGKKRKKWSND